MRSLLLIGATISTLTAFDAGAASSKPQHHRIAAQHHLIPGSNPYIRSLYGQWSNVIFGADDTAFPIAVFFQDPLATPTFYGSYANVAAAVAGTGMNTFVLMSGHDGLNDWPETFGGDVGELAAIKSNGLYVIGGVYVPYNCDSSITCNPAFDPYDHGNLSVASILSLATTDGAQDNVIGYNMGDEPGSSPNGVNQGLDFATIPDAVAELQSYDTTRMITFNQIDWMIQPYFNANWSAQVAALQSIPIGSFDYYPMTNNYWIWYDVNIYPIPLLSGTKSDFTSASNDTLWVQGISVQALASDALSNQPLWVFVETGTDALTSGSNNTLKASVSSDILTNESGWSSFSPTWNGLTVSDTTGANIIPPGTTITYIDATHAMMSANATGTSTTDTVAVTGGAPFIGAGVTGSSTTSDCVESENLCVVNGNEWRATLSEVNSEAWMSLISGANGIEWFCHDSASEAFCLGDEAGGSAANAAQSNLSYIDGTILTYALQLNQASDGICSMTSMNNTTGVISVASSCTNGNVTMSTSNGAVPGMVRVTHVPSSGKIYVFVMSDRRSSAGAEFTFTLPASAGLTAKTVYDSNAEYDSAHSSVGSTFTLDGSGNFSDTFGANNDNYQVKIYRINP